MSGTPEAIQDLLEELEASKLSRLRAWSVLQRLRVVLSELGNVAIPAPKQKTFDAEGGNLGTFPHEVFPRSERCHQKSVLRSTQVPRCYHQGKCKGDYPQALQAMLKALD